jgi:hypothetical protein
MAGVPPPADALQIVPDVEKVAVKVDVVQSLGPEILFFCHLSLVNGFHLHHTPPKANTLNDKR